MSKPPVRVKLEGAEELKRALSALGTEVSTRIGVTANRKAAKTFADAVAQAAPEQSGTTEQNAKFGHLKQNIKVTKVRGRSAQRIIYVVHTAKAFWGRFVEFGTVHAGAQPFMRSTWDRMREELVSVQMTELRRGIDRAAKRLAKTGRPLPPILKDQNAADR